MFCLKVNSLGQFYASNHKQLIATRELFGENDLEGPLLMDLTQYWKQPVKLLIIGQETKGWNSEYKDIESLKKTYREFNMGEGYYSSPFWNLTRKLESKVGIPAYSCA